MAGGKYRDKKLGKFIQQEISLLLSKGLKDHRLSEWTTITEVRVSKDLRNAMIYFSVYGSDKDKKDTLKALQSAKGFIKNHLSKYLRIRFMPELNFKLDESLDRANNILAKIDKISQEFQDEEAIEIEGKEGEEDFILDDLTEDTGDEEE